MRTEERKKRSTRGRRGRRKNDDTEIGARKRKKIIKKHQIKYYKAAVMTA